LDRMLIDDILAKTLADRTLSRGERQALSQLLGDLEVDDAARTTIRARAFLAAQEAVDDPRARAVVDWLEDVFKVIDRGGRGPGTASAGAGAGAGGAASGTVAEAHFSPGPSCLNRVIGLLRAAARTADLCIFTIADDRITRAIREAHGRRVRVRIVTDNDKMNDLGSDVDELARAGIPVAIDRSSFHMHHKFAVFDGRLLLTGSYNWTRQAAESNEENVVVTDDPRLVAPFVKEFERLFAKLA